MIDLELRPRRRRRPVLNVTSLIDVLFLLLIFFMVSSTFIEHPAIELDLPQASSAESVEIDSLRLTISPREEIYLDGEVVTLGELPGRLREAVAGNPERVLILEADRRVGYGLIIEVIDLARKEGVRRISAFTAMPEDR